MSQPTVIDLFCGAGGLSLGFHAAGCRIVAAVDVDEVATRTFSENFARLQPDAPPQVFSGEEGDLRTIDLERVPGGAEIDILIGGPPCQGFSQVGRAKLAKLSEQGFVNDPRNDLYERFLDAAELWKPRAVVMENVPGMRSVQGRDVADEAASDLASRGYRVGHAVLNAVWYGVPQYRERLFFIGIREDLGQRPHMPVATHRASLPAGYLRPTLQMTLPLIPHHELAVDVDSASEPAVTVAQALDDLPRITEHLSANGASSPDASRELPGYRGPAHSSYARLMRAWPGLEVSDGVADHIIRRTPRDYETFRRMQHGDRYPQAIVIARQRFAEELARLTEAGDAPAEGTVRYGELERRFVPPYREQIFVDKWRKLVPGEPSWTIPAHLSKDSYSHIHHDSDQARAISIREAARLQSFPDGFRLHGNMGDRFRQIGNAVPPLLARSVAGAVLDVLAIAQAPALREDEQAAVMA